MTTNRNIFSYLILLILITVNLNSQNNSGRFEISPRVGNEISPDEKLYFNLFPKIKNFKSAKSFINDRGEKCIVVKYDSSNAEYTVNFTINEESAENLRNAIEKFEQLYVGYELNKEIGIKWDSIIHKFISPAFRYNSVNKDIIQFKTLKGELVNGIILTSDSTYLIITPLNYKYDWKTVKDNCKYYHYSEIDEITEPFSLKLIGNKELFQNNYSYFLESESFMKYVGSERIPLAPELESIVSINKNVYKDYKDSSQQQLTIIKSNKNKNFHINFGYSFPFNINQKIFFSLYYNHIHWVENGIFGGYWAGDVNLISMIGCKMNDNLDPSISFEYKILDDFNIGFMYRNYKSDYLPNAILYPNKELEINTNGNIYSIYTSYIQKHHDVFSYKLIDKIDLNYLIGFLLIESQYKVKINFNSYYEFDNRDEPIIVNSNTIGAIVALNLYFYFTNYLSLNSNFYAYLLADDKFKYWEYEFSDKDKIFVKETNIYFSDFGVCFGLGLHF